MRYRSTVVFTTGRAAAVAAAAALATAGVSRADPLVERGWDLFETVSSTEFNNVAFQGVPLGTFDFTTGTGGDFGRGIGTQNTGPIDTIVKRLQTADAPSEAIPVEMVALQMRSVSQTDFGLGPDFYYVTLQSARGGPTSTGTMTVTFAGEGDPHGTFDSSLNVAFDIRRGSLTGPIAFSGTLPLVSDDVPWRHDPVAGAFALNDVNEFLSDSANGRDGDFWPGFLGGTDPGPSPSVPPEGVPDGQLGFMEFNPFDPANERHIIRISPEPGTPGMLMLAAGAAALRRRRARGG